MQSANQRRPAMAAPQTTEIHSIGCIWQTTRQQMKSVEVRAVKWVWNKIHRGRPELGFRKGGTIRTLFFVEKWEKWARRPAVPFRPWKKERLRKRNHRKSNWSCWIEDGNRLASSLAITLNIWSCCLHVWVNRMNIGLGFVQGGTTVYHMKATVEHCEAIC